VEYQGLFDNIKTFDWKDLHHKDLKIYVTEQEGIRLVCGYDKSEERIYVLRSEQFESSTEKGCSMEIK
jgi:hypothetical protein